MVKIKQVGVGRMASGKIDGITYVTRGDVTFARSTLGYYLPDFIESFQGNDPTGIVEIKENNELDNVPVYNLHGVPVEKPTKGIYITNGKTVIVK